MRILGIDPGTTRIGYGLIEKSRELKLLRYGIIEVRAKGGAEKILELAEKFSALIEELEPQAAGVEKLYFAKNQKTALQVSEARGIIMHLLLKRNIAVKEFRPGDVKQAITNYGLADKKAVAKMVKKILGLEDLKGHDDASDALAIAITTAYSYNRLNSKIEEGVWQ